MWVWLAWGLCAAGAVLLVVLGLQLSFFNDDWYFLFQRPGLESGPGLDALLAPHNSNIVVLEALMYKVFVGAFGLGTQWPFRIVLGITMAALGGLVFVLVRERLGSAVGLAAAAVVLFLGSAWEATLFFAAYSHLGALTFGVAALLVLQRDTRRRNATACALLVTATLLGNLGLAFISGSVIAILLRRRPRQLWVPGVPALLFALWWLGYGHREPSGLSLHNLLHLPGYTIDSISIGIASITGLDHGNALHRAHLAAILVLVAVTVWLIRGGRPGPWVAVLGGTALTFWITAGLGYMPGREPIASRYQLDDGVLLILLAAELLRNTALPRALVALTVVCAGGVVVSNLLLLSSGFTFMQTETAYAKVDLGALEIAGPKAPGRAWLIDATAHDPFLSGITEDRYFAEIRRHGSPVFDTPGEIAAAPAQQRASADSVLSAAEHLVPTQLGRAPTLRNCRPLQAGSDHGAELSLGAGETVIRNLSAIPLVVRVRRFASPSRRVPIGFLAPRSAAEIRIAPDAAPLRWRISLQRARPTAVAPARICAV